MFNEQDIINTTIVLVKIDSRNGRNSEDKIVQYISGILSNLKVDFKIVNHEGCRKSIIAYYPGINQAKNFLVCGHLDTVNIKDISLSKDGSLDVEFKDNKIYGLGSSDMKSGLSSIIYALKYLVLNNIKPAYDIFFAFTGDEESDKAGALYLLKDDLIKNTKLMLVGEPTNLNLGLGSKGQVWLEVRFKGKSAHGSTPKKGKNAIIMALNFIQEILSPDFFEKNDIFFPKSTANIGFINAPGPFNVVQDNCVVGIDIRMSPPETIVSIKEKVNSALSREFKKNEYELKIVDALESSFIRPESKVAMKLKSIINKYVSGKRKISLSYATDGSVLNTHANIPFVILGPGIPEVIHSKEEYVPVDNIINCVEIYKDIFLNLDQIIL